MLFPFSFLLSRITQTQQYFISVSFHSLKADGLTIYCTSLHPINTYSTPYLQGQFFKGPVVGLSDKLPGGCDVRLRYKHTAQPHVQVLWGKKRSKTNVDQMSAPINNVCYFLHLLCRETAKERMINSCLLSGLFMERGRVGTAQFLGPFSLLFCSYRGGEDWGRCLIFSGRSLRFYRSRASSQL